MNYYYYPLCSKEFTFENIFASESISPPAFYSKRGFGMDFIFKINSLHHDSSLILYTQPPKYSFSDNEKDAVKFILKINESSIESNELIAIAEGVVAYPKTIYLNTDNAWILFFSERDKVLLSLKSETSLPTKNVHKYHNNFLIINEKECVIFEAIDLANLAFDTPSQEMEISYDRTYNSYKGFCYGLATGLLKDHSKEQVFLKAKLQEIGNSFGEFKSRVLNEAKGFSIKYNRKENTNLSTEGLQKTLISSIQETESLFKEFIGQEVFTDEKLEAYLLNQFSGYFSSPEDLKLYLRFKKLDDEIFGTNNFVKLKSKYLKENTKANPGLHFEILKEQVIIFSSEPRYNADWVNSIREKSNDAFKHSLFELTRLIDAKFLEKEKGGKIILDGISFNFESSTVMIEPGFLELNDSIIAEFSIVVNIVFHNAKFGKGEAKKELLLKIVEETGTALSKSRSGKDTQLYQYLNNEVHSYAIDKAQSSVMKNFVAFIFNSDSLEKLEKYLTAKSIEYKWMAYSFWCTFNGFSNTSKFFVAPFFGPGCEERATYIDSILYATFLYSRHSKGLGDRLLTIKGEKEQDSIDNQTDRIKDFYIKNIEGKFKISQEQFVFITSFNKKAKISSELKSKFRLSKKDADIIAELFIEYLKAPPLF